MPPDQQQRAARSFGEGYAYVGAGFTFALAILLFGAGGWVLDGWVGTRPLFAVLGAFLGGFAGFMSIYNRVIRDTEARKREPGAAKGPPGSRDS
jgi:F0F1-type ATP synthase assembly protein I